MKTIRFATTNTRKLQEVRAILADAGWTVEGIPAGVPSPDETGDTFAENARLKAAHYARFVTPPVFAEDSGLAVRALDGRPGTRPERFGEPGMDDAGRCAQVLRELEGVADRAAQFVACIALMTPDGELRVFEGVADGSIAVSPAGGAGFGYDPVFIPVGDSRTFGA